MKIVFIPECYADTTLIDFFLRDKSKRIHQRGNTKVADTMQKQAAQHYRIVGIVDADKRQPTYFQKIKEIKTFNNVALFQKDDSEQYLIMLKPALEAFLINSCKEISVELSDFELPNSLKELTAITKNVSIADNHKFKRLLKTLKDSPTFQNLDLFFKELETI